MDNGSIIRVKKKDRYVALSNSLLRDSRLTFEARGLLSYLLSMPSNWEVRFSHLIKQSPARRTVLRRVIKECISFGYMKRERTKVQGGRFQWVTEVFEEPLCSDAESVESEQAERVEGDSPSVGFRPMENPSTEHRSVDSLSVENLSIKENVGDELPTDERLNSKKTETTKAAAHVDDSPAPPSPPPSKVRVFIPNPFPLDAELLAWASQICPLVNVEDVASKLVDKYHPESCDKPPKKSMSLWREKLVQWIRREQKFEERDKVVRHPSLDADKPSPSNGGSANRSFAEEQAAKAQFSACPDCFGTGVHVVKGKGAKGRCAHSNMPQQEVSV